VDVKWRTSDQDWDNLLDVRQTEQFHEELGFPKFADSFSDAWVKESVTIESQNKETTVPSSAPWFLCILLDLFHVIFEFLGDFFVFCMMQVM
jgi:hypothetical protein